MCGPLLLSSGYNSNFVILLTNIVLSFIFRHYKITVVKLQFSIVNVLRCHPYIWSQPRPHVIKALNRLNPDICCSQLYLFIKLFLLFTNASKELTLDLMYKENNWKKCSTLCFKKWRQGVLIKRPYGTSWEWECIVLNIKTLLVCI